MKKLLAILLIIAMLVPMGITAQAESVAKKPFYLVNWENFPTVDPEVKDSLTNTFYMPKLWPNYTELKNDSELKIENVRVSAPDLKTSGTLAEKLKAYMDDMPEGSRYFNFNLPAAAIRTFGNICFVDHVVPVVSQWLDGFLKEYKSIGGKLDGMAVDVEYLYVSSNYIYNSFYNKDPLVYDKIVKHPSYTERIRPKLVERGFKFYSPVSEQTPEVFSIHPNSGSEYAQSRSIWNAVMRSYLNEVITECCEPIWKYYPEAMVSDYQSKNVDPWFKELDDDGDLKANLGGSYFTAGNCSNDNFYCVRPNTTFFKDGNNPLYNTLPGYNEVVFENTKFNRFLFDMNTARNTYLAADNGQVCWWLGHAYYGSRSHNAYFAETMLHLALLDPQIFLGYIMPQDCKTNGVKDPVKYGNAFVIADQCMRMASNVAGYADRKPLIVEHNWNYHFVLSGMYANGRNIFRITPDTDMVSLEEFQVKDAQDLTFKIDGVTVTFPGGKIIPDSEVYDIGTCGFWVETAKDVMPIISKGEDFYKNNPAYQENFDSFEVGMEYNYNNSQPATCWEIKTTGKDSSATVVADPTDANNKMLAAKGKSSFKNLKLPRNVMGGDTYAKNQAWSISFILPADMAADAELQLLNAVPKEKKAKDQGIKIAGGKVYYDQAGEYVEMEGVTLTAGVKYTVVREMNFTTEDAYTCSYYVYGADGAELGKATKIPTAKMDIPVYSVQFSTNGVAGEAVLFDDYKLYTTKVNTDFYLYDAKTGVPVAELDKAREGDTAYHFAWINSTNEEKSYSVMAAYYDGETKVSEEVIKEVKLAPNENGAEIGEFENKQEGKTMLIYLKDNNPAEEDPTATPGGDEPTPEPEPNGPDTKMIIIIAAAAAAVVIAVVVIVIVAASKKKKKAAAAKAEAAEEIAEEATVETNDETTEE